ncbi:protein-L-isoaspartate O-methyltransferase family protein [Hirschia baltica]|uniref:Protein-L-isoaspartate O-methyltransferase n=1 Tax=Hirschia baltica (strain ATCC 49814 / DSM 5838 / IFAM 1418) TaxID=582402 RepID=C6XIS3_HIRBI|nr:protein-L-isoaspartate O-methyltransferase [Hirschia baltica]ACT59018.1 protein-L-isoaspartate(D-aspartate) O-methyltransferase [Hirschia baltica ATCC 49814]
MNDAVARETMIDTQVRPNDVTDRRIHAALQNVPREVFLPKSRHSLAYAEFEHETSQGRYMWRARDFAKLVEAAKIQADDEVLDVASGSGYSAAILAKLAAAVVGVETDEALAEAASARLDSLDIDNADVVAGDISKGLASQGPFDVIFVNGSVEVIPQEWKDQLKQNGRLAVIVREGKLSQARIYTRSGDSFACRSVFDAAPPALPGFEKAESFVF